MIQQGAFEIGLTKMGSFCQTCKLEHVWIFDFFLRRDCVFGFRGGALGEHFRFVAR